MPNWVVNAWGSGALDVLDHQWEITADFWRETDRLAAPVTEIRRIGGRAEETADGLRIEPGQLHPAVMRSYEDHRMATAAAVIGLVLDGVQVEDIATTAKTLPQFPQLWNQMVTGSVLDTGAVPVQPGSSPVPQRPDSHGAR